MKRTLTLAAAALLLASGCGQTGAGSVSARASRGGVAAGGSVGDCTARAPAIRHAPVVTRADLDGDGAPEDILRTVLHAADCPDYLVADVGGRLVGSSLADITPRRLGFDTVKIPGRDREIVVVHATHPRGGFETHVFGYADGQLGEIRDARGGPLVPFAATDTNSGYVSATCGHGTLVVRRAVAHQPAAAATGLSVLETTYRLDGTTATRTDRRQVDKDVPAQALARRYPALAHREMFRTGCRG